MTVPDVRLHPGDAAELAEILEFLDDWLATGDEHLHGSLSRFIGSDAYRVSDLRGDLARFAFLLGATDGDRLFSRRSIARPVADRMLGTRWTTKRLVSGRRIRTCAHGSGGRRCPSANEGR